MADKYVNASGLSRFLTKIKAYIADALSSIPASGITGVLAVANGGTGASGIVEQTGVAGSPNKVTITTSTMERWGKLVMVSIGFSVTSNLNNGNDYKIAELVSAARPLAYTGCHMTGGLTGSCRLYPDGSVMVRPIGTIASGSAFSLMATYLVA